MKNFTIIFFTLLSIFTSTFCFGASISGQVWFDEDNDDLQGNVELGLEGVVVFLLDGSSTVISTDTTDVSGAYLFSGLNIGDYYVQFDIQSAPIGFRKPAAQHVGFFLDVDSDADNTGLTGNINLPNVTSDIVDVDFGLQVSPTGILSGMVWEDMNGNDIRDGGDVGLAGVIVSLDDSLGNSVHVDTTDVSGQYLFLAAEYGKYVVNFSLSSFPAGYNPVTKNIGSDVTIDSDANSNGLTDTITLTGDISNIDLGLRNAPPTATLSGKVWYDGNNNGLFEAAEIGISNIYVHLLDTLNNILLKDTTDVNGQYSFGSLLYNQYFIEFDTLSILSSYEIVAPNVGVDDNIDSDAFANGKTDTISLQGDILNVDMGLFTAPTLGAVNGKVWKDDNNDDLFTFGEIGLANIPVYLISLLGDTTMTAITGIDGRYDFLNIPPEDYKVAFGLSAVPAGFTIAVKDVGADDGIDSDVDLQGVSDGFTLLAGNTVGNVDMGLYPPVTAPTFVTDTIFLEVNSNDALVICLDSTELPGNIVSSSVIIAPQNGLLSDFSSNCFNYTPDMDYVGLDSFGMILCDDLINCDTTFILMNVKGLLSILPVAVNDVDTVVQGVPAQLQVISNDTLYAPLVSLKIIDYPTLGVAETDVFGFIKYVSEPNVCDETVVMTYEVCTQFGCDTADVTVYLECNDISIVEGFSPNGDGINETFVIKGISEYPNNRLMIFNRWGNVVLDQNNYNNLWTGYWDDENTYLPSGTYFYIFETGDGGRMTGNFELIR